ncbi:siderophore-interacting protein [Eionea flava]
MSLREIRRIFVSRKQLISPNMLRIVFSGEDLASFPEDFESGYIKLRFLMSQNEVYPSDSGALDEKARVRSYTIRHFDLAVRELTVDFALHGDEGPASFWAQHCAIGDEITMDGPGPAKIISHDADWFFLVGDMTALPALSVNLEKLPASAKGYVVIEVLSEADKILPLLPSGMQVHWVINSHPSSDECLLANAVKALPWQPGNAAVWAATEFGVMKQLRKYFKHEQEVDSKKLYISSYWKLGGSDEEHKKAKKMDAEK